MTRYPRGKLSNMLPPLIWIVHFNKSKECHWQRLQNHIVFKTLELLPWSIFLKLICCVEFFSVIILLSRARILKTRKMISQKRCAAYSRQSPHLHSLSVKILYRGVMDRALYTEMVLNIEQDFCRSSEGYIVLFFCLFVFLRLYHDPLYRKKAGYNYSVYLYHFLSILASLVSVQFGSAIFAGSWISK